MKLIAKWIRRDRQHVGSGQLLICCGVAIEDDSDRCGSCGKLLS
jgi:hypothetical protein